LNAEATGSSDEVTAESHELVSALAALGIQLSPTLVDMLNEHYSHRTERRGCGFTQATRVLATVLNTKDGGACAPKLFAHIRPNMDLQRALVDWLPGRLEREESRLLAGLIGDIVLRNQPFTGVPELPPFPGELKVGTCPLAEKYFLEISDRFVRRKGRVNVLVSAEREPLLIEKVGLGEDHSCISLAPVVLNRVRLPPGCLLGVARPEGGTFEVNKALPGSIVPIAFCSGFRFLRLTTLAVSPQHRRRAFSSHFQSQIDAGLFAPGEATIEQLRTVAMEQLP
jgi:hypothetical protein